MGVEYRGCVGSLKLAVETTPRVSGFRVCLIALHGLDFARRSLLGVEYEKKIESMRWQDVGSFSTAVGCGLGGIHPGLGLKVA